MTNACATTDTGTILITGGDGALGRFVTREVIARGGRAVVLSRHVAGVSTAHRLVAPGSITDASSLDAAVRTHEVTAIIHLAAAVGEAAETGIAESLVAGVPVRIAHGGDAVDDFSDYADLAGALVTAATIETDLQAVYHVASGRPHTLGDIAEAVRERIPDADIEIGPGTDFFGLDHNLQCVLAIDEAQRDLGYHPRSLGAWVDAYIDRITRPE